VKKNTVRNLTLLVVISLIFITIAASVALAQSADEPTGLAGHPIGSLPQYQAGTKLVMKI